MSQAPESPQKRKSVPIIELTGDDERTYIEQLAETIRLARLNVHWPDARALRCHVEAMSPKLHRGLYPCLQVDLRSGLPTYREWTRVQTDVTVAPDALTHIRDRELLKDEVRAGGDAIYAKQLLKHDYYQAIKDLKLAKLGHMEVFLRKVDTATQTGYFNVILDKLDASGVFVRFTIDLAQHSSVWNKKLVRLDEDTAEHTQEFRTLIYRFTSYDAEMTFFKLVTMGGLTVERVVKGTVGPIFFAGRRSPGPLGKLLSGKETGFIANFSLDMAAIDISEDRDNDPLEDTMSSTLSEKARADYEQARERWGYKVFKDRKFVTTRDLAAEVKRFCKSSGTSNIIKTLRKS